jgi:hypothetical protein
MRPFNLGNTPNMQMPAQATTMFSQPLGGAPTMPTLPSQASPQAFEALANNFAGMNRNIPTLPEQANPRAYQAINNQGFQGRPEFAQNQTADIGMGMNPGYNYGYGQAMNQMPMGYGQGFGPQGFNPQGFGQGFGQGFVGQQQPFGGLFNTPYLPSGNQLGTILQMLQMLNAGRRF